MFLDSSVKRMQSIFPHTCTSRVECLFSYKIPPITFALITQVFNFEYCICCTILSPRWLNPWLE